MLPSLTGKDERLFGVSRIPQYFYISLSHFQSVTHALTGEEELYIHTGSNADYFIILISAA